MEEDPKERKYESVLEYILAEDLEGELEGAEEILRERCEDLEGHVKRDIVNEVKKHIQEREIEDDSEFEVYPVLAKSSVGDPDEGVFLVGQIRQSGEINLEVVDFKYSGYEYLFELVEGDSFYHPTY
jgi:hypothetical protein